MSFALVIGIILTFAIGGWMIASGLRKSSSGPTSTSKMPSVILYSEQPLESLRKFYEEGLGFSIVTSDSDSIVWDTPNGFQLEVTRNIERADIKKLPAKCVLGVPGHGDEPILHVFHISEKLLRKQHARVSKVGHVTSIFDSEDANSEELKFYFREPSGTAFCYYYFDHGPLFYAWHWCWEPKLADIRDTS